MFGIPISILLVLTLLFSLCGGRQLPTWMFINSMQLIFHLSLIKTDLPAVAQFFLIKYLNWLRFNFDWSKNLSDDTLGSADLLDYKLL